MRVIIKLFFIVSLFFCFLTNAQHHESDLVGEWQCIQYTCGRGLFGQNLTEHKRSMRQNPTYLTLKEDGSFTSTLRDMKGTGTWVFKNGHYLALDYGKTKKSFHIWSSINNKLSVQLNIRSYDNGPCQLKFVK